MVLMMVAEMMGLANGMATNSGRSMGDEGTRGIWSRYRTLCEEIKTEKVILTS